MLGVGDRMPGFVARDSSGGAVDSATLLGAPFVLFFYPRAQSLGCTREARAFAVGARSFERRGVRIVGISVDPPDAQRRFAEKCRLPFPLLSDTTREVARSFGVLGAFGWSRRVTFLFDATGTVRFRTERTLPGLHVEEALRAAEAIFSPTEPP